MREGISSPGTQDSHCGAPKGAATEAVSPALNSRQRVWIHAHLDAKPFRRAWLDKDRRQVRGPPETWVYLRAWFRHGFNVSRLCIRAEDREGLAPYFDPATGEVTAAGRALWPSFEGDF